MNRIDAEYIARANAEREKAVRKYGEEALVPTGRPEYDISDYAINEIIGLVRYAEMLKARAEMMSMTFEGADRRRLIAIIRDQIAFANDLAEGAVQMSKRLIGIRQRFLSKGLHLGLTEDAS